MRITAPPEGGRANKAICTLIATTLGVKRRDVTIESGHGSAEKTIRIRGIDGAAITESL